MFDICLAVGVDEGKLGILKARCCVSLLDMRPLSLRRSQFTSAASPMR